MADGGGGGDAARSPWGDWTLVVLARRGGGASVADLQVLQDVAARYADRFSPDDRVYDADVPRWHSRVRDALVDLRRRGLAEGDEAFSATAQGLGRADEVRERVDTRPPVAAVPEPVEQGQAPRERRPLLTPGVIASPLRDTVEREKMHFPTDDDTVMPVMVELNLRYTGGPAAAFEKLRALWERVTDDSAPRRLADEYATGELTMNEMKRLVSADAVPGHWSQRSIFHLWPDFPVRLHVDASAMTIKVDAARRAFNAYGARIVWAVVDSGIDANHPHFIGYDTLKHPSVKDLHCYFPPEGEPQLGDAALVDDSGHGTHVAGIIAGGIQPWLAEKRDGQPPGPGAPDAPGDPAGAAAGTRTVKVTQNRFNVENPVEPLRTPRELDDLDDLAGMAPKTRLVSLRAVHRGGGLDDRVSRVIAALAYVREVNGQGRAGMRIHGVNLSVGYEFNPEWFACGQSPLCQEVDKLVRSGVVVVVAAGNSGFGTLGVLSEAPTKFGLDLTINDPGNAERAITVGATHRDMPHTYGVSYFSSKGPTGDGRSKPDLVAPGERITSCAAGQALTAVMGDSPPPDTAVYVEESGTSMAAPHVSGAIAAFLSVRREFIGRPETVKTIVVDAATTLGRQPHFQGSGLLDLMRALQSV